MEITIFNVKVNILFKGQKALLQVIAFMFLFKLYLTVFIAGNYWQG